VVDGLGHIVHERLFAVEIGASEEPRLRETTVLGNFTPVEVPAELPSVAEHPEVTAWLNEHALQPFLETVRAERVDQVDRIAHHVEVSLQELLEKADEDIGRIAVEKEQGVRGVEGRLSQAEMRHQELLERRERRRRELSHERAVSLQGVERLTTVLVLPHPEREDPTITKLRPNLETEAMAMQVVMDYERSEGREPEDVHEKDLGYDITSMDSQSGEMRLIEVKGLRASTGSILLSPNERRVAEDRRDCFWLYVVTNCAEKPILQKPIRDPAQYQWHEVTKVQHYWLNVNAMTQPMMVREDSPGYSVDE